MHSNGSVNILNKEDKSLSGFDDRTKAAKRLTFKWTTVGSQGTFAWIDKHKLNIDGRYQRDQCSKNKVLEIARAWDWLLIGTLSVIEREDGTFWVFDGGHRTRASFYRDDISLLPCMVHKLANVSDEAKAFVARNTMVSNVASMDRYRASICAGEPVAVTTDAILEELGLTPVSGGYTTSKYISCVGTLQKCVAANADDARKVLGFCIKLAGESNVAGKVLAAMFALYQHFKHEFDFIDKFGDKILKHSQREVEIKINQFQVECGRSGQVVAAKAILDIANHRNRYKINW